MPLTRVDCLLDIAEGTDWVSEKVAAAAPLEFDADGGADEASWTMAGGGREVEAVEADDEWCSGRPSTTGGGGEVDWSLGSCSSPGPDGCGSAWLDAAGLSF